MTSRSRAYCFTINNPTFIDHHNMLTLLDKCDYSIIGFERGSETETPHIQGYLYKHNKISFNVVKRFMPRAHIEIAKGSPQQNTIYCSKEGSYLQFGTMPSQGTITWEHLEQVMADPKNHIQLYNQYRRVYYDLKAKEQRKDTERQLFFIPRDKRFLIPFKTILMDGDIETYEGEDAIVFDTYFGKGFDVTNWIQGYPPKIRRGYEIVKIDPKAIYVTYDDEKELNYLKKRFLDIVYQCPTLDAPVSEEELSEDDQDTDVPWSGHPESFH